MAGFLSPSDWEQTFDSQLERNPQSLPATAGDPTLVRETALSAVGALGVS